MRAHTAWAYAWAHGEGICTDLLTTEHIGQQARGSPVLLQTVDLADN